MGTKKPSLRSMLQNQAGHPVSVRISITVSTYPDSQTLGTQAFNLYIGYPQPYPTDAMSMDPDTYILHGSGQQNMLLIQPHNRLVYYSQTQATSLVTNVWGGSGVTPYAANNPDDNITFDPSLPGNNFWNSNHSVDCYQPLLHASPFGN